MKRKKFAAALFDVDGTVLNTREYIFQAYKYTINLHLKKDVAWKEVAKVVGLSLKQCYQLLTKLDEVDNLMKCHDDFQRQHVHLATAYPNTLPTLKTLAKSGVGMAAVTNRLSDQLIETLKFTGLDKYFKAVPLDIKKPKPHPESIFKALEVLKVKPERAIFIGDSKADIEAGKAAGVKTIAALYGFHGEELRETKPDYAVSDIQEVVSIILE